MHLFFLLICQQAVLWDYWGSVQNFILQKYLRFKYKLCKCSPVKSIDHFSFPLSVMCLCAGQVFFSPALNSVQASILHSTVYIVNVHVHVLMDLLLCHQMVSHQSLDDILYMYVNKCVSVCVCVAWMQPKAQLTLRSAIHHSGKREPSRDKALLDENTLTVGNSWKCWCQNSTVVFHSICSLGHSLAKASDSSVLIQYELCWVHAG